MQSPESTGSNGSRYILQIYVGALSAHYEALSVEASKATTAEEIVSCIVDRLILPANNHYELAEVAGECKERRLSPNEKPVSVMLLWPMHSQRDFHRFYLRESSNDVPWMDSYGIDPQILRDFIPFLMQPENREYPDLCQLLDLNESTLLENLRQRFDAGHIYTYVGSILIAVNPFKFHPIYNPKYVRLYQNQRVGPILPPHIFAIADNAYYCMLKEKRNQCVVISGESGSGKTESTNFLLHHLTALSQKGLHGSGVEQTILSAGPVLEAFGNAKTAHNNNSSRFGKFIQVNYRENGMVQGAVVQKYLLEKSRIVSQGPFERNYHVFYYLLSGATEQECEALHLLPPEKYCYLNAKNLTLENCDEKYEFSRLKQSMEMVGFSAEKQRRLFTVLSAVLLLGNVEFFPKKSTYHHDESVQVRNLGVVALISELLKVKHDTLLAALTSKRVKASGETLIMQYKLPEAIAARDALAKCLYGALFDWIVLQVNHALLNKDQVLYTGHSIGVLDIFGFEDFGSQNSFEQLCINYANEHLQYYFNLHVFKYEQNEYKREGIKWRDIDFLDNSGCLQLFESKPTGLLCILDDLCNFPGATNETLLQKFNSVHKESKFYEKPQKKENAFIIKHYAGKVKYQVAEMREKNLDLMRQDIVSVLKNSSMAFVRELVGADPVAVFRWAIIRAFFRGYFAFRNAGAKHRKERNDQSAHKMSGKNRFRQQNDMILSQKVTSALSDSTSATTTPKYSPPAVASGPNHPLGKNPRKWSVIAYNNKNFPDAKLVYEHQQMGGNATSGQNVSWSASANHNTSMTTSAGNNNKLLGKGYSKFERSGQEVMARASQIVLKNKSFRPRERPKKGLKNLQTVKTLTAGQNLSNPSTVKTRKQPLTVTAQFQNSLAALMDTLNQANPFFIRCIKSNPNKIPNKFDEATVIRQLRYTGMLETVRIRRAGYNVRLTYEEFIQLYRILLPKGLVSSQKDVRDFMNTMNLNKQHYQLGVSKIYMRESEKTRLDVRLHTKIIESIVMIQRWFRCLLQRRKFTTHRAAAVCIQTHWRNYLTERNSARGQLKIRACAAIVIQAQWRMFVEHRWYTKLLHGVVLVQAHIRGKLARISAREKLARHHKSIKDRHPLRPTQSLPASERSLDVIFDPDANKQPFNIIIPHHSVDSALDTTNLMSGFRGPGCNYSASSSSGVGSGSSSVSGGSRHLEQLSEYHKRDLLYAAENQLQSLMISSPSSTSSYGQSPQQAYAQPPPIQPQHYFNINREVTANVMRMPHHDYQNMSFAKDPSRMSHTEDTSASMTDSRSSLRAYDLDREKSKVYTRENSGNFKYLTRRSDSVDTQRSVCPTDSLPAINYKNRSIDLPSHTIPSQPTPPTQLQSQPNTSSPISQPPERTIVRISNNAANAAARRELVCRSTGDELSPTAYPPKYSGYHHPSTTSDPHRSPHSLNVSQNSHQSAQSPLPHSSPNHPSHHFDDSTSSISSSNTVYTTPSKAAAFLGTISENLIHPKGDHTPIHKSRRGMKHNMSDDYPTAATPYQPITRAPGDSLRRRNSDPSSNPGKVPLLEVNRGNDMYQSSTHINIAGHRFHKATRISKAEMCASCKESDAFVNEGHRCMDCKVLVHTKCIQNGGVKTLQCEAKRSKRLRKNVDKSMASVSAASTPNSKYSGTREYTDSTDKIISDAKELQLMQDFITQKICKMDNDCEKPSEVDRVFKQSLREFKDNLVAQYSVAHKQNSDTLNIKYRDLIANFEHVMETCGGRRDDIPLTMGVNAFRGFLNEFMSSRETEKPKAKRKKEKKRKVEEHTSFNGHTFQLLLINIPTACEICQLFLMWPIERGLVCQNCRLTCHKKCYQKSHGCNKVSGTDHHSMQNLTNPNSTLFGIPLTVLCASSDGIVKIPAKIDQLITKIEMHGLYTEGIYRKSGVNSKIKELKNKMSEAVGTGPCELDYESYNVHVLANVLKSFLRDMPEPLLSFDRYDDFLRASELSETVDRVSTLMSLIKKLPPSHHALLERLVFHLALVAQREKDNRMSASSLAIVFAPCVLRTNRQIPAQDSLNDIGRQTKCIETLITQKMMNVKSTLADIDTLDTAAHTASTRLTTIRRSKVFTAEELVTQRPTNNESETEEMLLEDHIQEIKKEKEMLTSTLPSLARANSDDDLLSTDMDGEGGSLDDLSSKDSSNGPREPRDLKDSIDSMNDNVSRRTIDSDSTSTTSTCVATRENSFVDGEMNEPVAVSYNLREQNIDYIQQTPPRHQYQARERDAFIKNSYSVPKVTSTSTATTASRWTGSQQNLNYTTPSPSGGSELQRQKPLAVRSMSGGYEPTAIVHIPTIVSQSPISNANIVPGKHNVSRNAKRQNSLDDEPIMV